MTNFPVSVTTRNSSGSFTSASASGLIINTFLLDSFPGATVLLSLSKENSSFPGNALTVSSSTGTSSTNIGFAGNNLDTVALNAAIAANRNFVDTWYDQSGNGNDATQVTLSRRWKIIVDVDGKPSLIGSNAQGMEIADASSHKTAKIDVFFVGKIGVTYNDSTNYDTVIASWMATSATLAESQARWGFVLSEGGFGDGLELVKNATKLTRSGSSIPANIPLGNGYRSTFHVWNYSSERLSLRRNDVSLWDDATINSTTPSDVTYTGTGKLYLGNNAAYTQASRGTFRTFAIYGTTRSDHSGITSYLMTKWSTAEFPTSYSSGDGWLWTPQYNSIFILDSADDVNGLRWWYETGAYADNGVRGPSIAKASNVNNGAAFMRFAVDVNDNDTIVTGAERSERGGHIGASTAIAVGDNFERFMQFYIEPGPTQTGSWCLAFQIHYGNGAGSPDIMFINLKADQFQVFSSRAGVDTARSTATAYTRGTWYALRVSGHWSGASSDTLNVWLGPNGSTLPQVTNASGALFDTGAIDAFIKQGIYRGFPADNTGVFAMRFANEQFSKTTGAYSSFVTTQPALPTHP